MHFFYCYSRLLKVEEGLRGLKPWGVAEPFGAPQTGSYQLWVDTKSHPPTTLLWRSLWHEIYVPTSELSSKTWRWTQGQDLTLNFTNSGMGPSQSFMECPYATKVLWHWKNIFVVPWSSSRTASTQCPVYEKMRWPCPQVSSPSWLDGTFLVLALKIPCLGKSLNLWETRRAGHPTWAIVLSVTCWSWILHMWAQLSEPPIFLCESSNFKKLVARSTSSSEILFFL